ncbi:hypothetical protein BZG36_04523, partial [Bifiguratus adelaidae]
MTLLGTIELLTTLVALVANEEVLEVDVVETDATEEEEAEVDCAVEEVDEADTLEELVDCVEDDGAVGVVLLNDVRALVVVTTCEVDVVEGVPEVAGGEPLVPGGVPEPPDVGPVVWRCVKVPVMEVVIFLETVGGTEDFDEVEAEAPEGCKEEGAGVDEAKDGSK